MNLGGPAGGWQVPAARLPTIVTSGVNDLPFAVPAEPVQHVQHQSSGPMPPAAVLQAATEALLRADISNVRPRLPPAHYAPQPGSLEHAVLLIDKHVFVHAARTHTAVAAPVQKLQQEQQPEQRQDTAKAARPLPAAEKQVPAPKRRKKALVSDEEFVASVVNVEQVAADVAANIGSFLEEAASLQADQGKADQGNEADEEMEDAQPHAANGTSSAVASSRQRLSQPFLSLEMLKALHASLSNGKQAGVIRRLDEEQLRSLLLLLLGHVQLGENKLLSEHEAANSGTSKAIAVSLEAACCCLQLLAAPGLPNSLYMDELVTAAVQLAKYQLQYNVLAFHDAQCKRLYRPASAQDAQPSASKKNRADSASKVPRAASDVQAKLELLLSLLAQVVDRVLLEVELLLPLLRISLTCLSVDSLQLLQTEAIALAVAVFRAYPQQRSSLLDEVMSTVIANISLPSARGPPRMYEATDAAQRSVPIQMATALVMQLVQASAQLPAVDAEPGTIQGAFRGAFAYSDMFWHGVFARLPAAKAAKSDGAADFKAVIDALLADLLAVQMLPEWPAATILLRRFLKMLSSDKGLKHPDSAVKLAAVEFTGLLAARLCSEALQAEQDADAVQAVLEAAEAAADPALLGEGNRSEQVLNSLLLDYLAAAPGSSKSSTAAAARRFMCCHMLNEVLVSMRQLGSETSNEELRRLLVQHRQLQDSTHPVLGPGMSEVQLTRAQYVSMVRHDIMVSGPLGPGRAALIKWLVETGSRQGPNPNPATVRTKVYKCLSSVVEADSRVLGLPDVAAAVRAALDDDSVAVREATLELLAKLIATNPTLAGEYFDVLVTASHDSGVSVRKRAIRSLWECCTCPGFARAAEAVVAVLQRAADPEESMRGLVNKICGEMWFSEGSSFAGLTDGAASSTAAAASSCQIRTATLRARELAELSLKVYEAGGKAIHVPLPPEHPLVVIVQGVLGTSSTAATAAATKEHAALQAGAREVAEALLAAILQQEADDSTGGDQFPCLLALHALCAADASLAVPKAEPQRFIRCLAPYISKAGRQQGILGRTNSNASGGLSGEDASRRSAEECLCLLAILQSLLLNIGAVDQEDAQQISADLLNLINKQRYLQLVAAGCELLCTLAPLYPAVVSHISQLATKCYTFALPALSGQQQGLAPTSPAQLQVAPKVLYILGQLCRHGASLLDAAAADNPGMRNCTECLELCVSLWYRPDMPDTPVGQRVRDAALQALGMIVIGKPQLMLQQLQLSLLADCAPAAGPTAAIATRVSDRGSPNHDDDAAGANDGAATGVESPGEGGDDSAAAASGQQGIPGLAKCAADVYAAALAGQQYSIAVKTRVLTNLVELLRSEESALEARQQEDAAASTASRLASTKPSAACAPLAMVNGQTDTALGTCIVQRVWKDVVRLATGVPQAPGATVSGMLAATPGGGAAAAADAASMRRRALDVIEVVLRCGLMGPWDAGAPLVAQLTDEAPETRTAALKVLQFACTKYQDYISAQLAPGVTAAYHFQSRLWAAKHPGQPLPRSPKPEVLEGLAAMYQQIVFPGTDGRRRFLGNLLKPFAVACSLADAESASREDAHKLAFLAYVAAALPFKRADEPLLLIHFINSHVSRQSQEVLDCLRRQLLQRGLRAKMGMEDDVDAEDDVVTAAAAVGALAAATGDNQGSMDAASQHQTQHGKAPQPQQQNGKQGLQPLSLPFSVELLAPLKASLGLSMLLVLKQYLMAAYSLPDERVAAFELKGERYRNEVKALVSKAKGMKEFSLLVVNLRVLDDATGDLLCEQLKTFRGLLDNDAANYKEAAVLAALADHDEDEDAPHVSATPAAEAAAAAKLGHLAGDGSHTGLVVYSIDTKKAAKTKAGKSAAKSTSRGTAASTGGKRSARGAGSTARGKGRAGSTARGKAKKRKRFGSDEDTDDDEDWVDGAVPKKELF